jgi:hypothetical protein
MLMMHLPAVISPPPLAKFRRTQVAYSSGIEFQGTVQSTLPAPAPALAQHQKLPQANSGYAKALNASCVPGTPADTTRS